MAKKKIPAPVVEAPAPVAEKVKRTRAINPEIAATRAAVKEAKERAREVARAIQEENRQAKLDKKFDILERKEAVLLNKIDELQKELATVRAHMAGLTT